MPAISRDRERRRSGAEEAHASVPAHRMGPPNVRGEARAGSPHLAGSPSAANSGGVPTCQYEEYAFTLTFTIPVDCR